MAKGIFITAGIILAVIAISVGGIFLLSNVIPQAGVQSGFAPIALSRAEFRSIDNQFFNGEPMWILTTIQNKLGARAEGNFDNSEIVDDENEAQKDFTISIDYQNQECVSPIGSTNLFTPLKNVAIVTWARIPFVNPCNSAESNERANGNVLYFGKNTGNTCWAIYETGEQSPVGTFTQTDLRTQMTVNVEAGDRSGSIDLDSEDGVASGMVSDFAFVDWVGNLDTGKSCPYTTTNPFHASYVSGRWRIINANSYDSWLGAFNSVPSANPVPEAWVNNINSLVNTARISQNFGTIDGETSFSSAVLRKEMEFPLQKPQIVIYVRADTLGFFVPTAKIKLESAESECFRTGEDGVISITAENIGDENGVWSFFGTCENPAFDIVQSREYSIRAGRTRTVSLPLSGEGSKKETGTCEIFAENNVGDLQSIDVGVCVDPQITCNAREKFCSTSGGADVVRQCSSDGATSEIVDTCASGEVCLDAKCVDEGSGGSGCGFFCNLLGNSFLGNIFNSVNDFMQKFRLAFSALIGLIGAVLIGSYYRRIADLAKLPKGGKAMFITAFIVGALLGYLAFLFFWIIVAVLVVLIIIRIIL